MGIVGVLVFDDTGITGYPGHQATGRAAVLAAVTAGLPVLAWTLPAMIAGRLRAPARAASTGSPRNSRPMGEGESDGH